MATIPLREYCREIENMIDKGHTEEAIAHCRHILKHFPKHIETYRLLGKSYLESRQLGDAADIFQRVLSSIPEDFVSHIGMSIIREDEGNVDAAIWHMERAYEVQSSNLAIQDELRRLYAQRDGQEPHKIRLTRGALAHMYAHGHLYSQAIAELRAALSTDPKRLDLQVLLAKMYYADKQQANAAKTASQLITKLPYCLDANRILAEILTSSQRANEAASHNTRVQELDPYYKHISPQHPTLDVVPSGVIVLEILDWEATKGGLISQPAWATSIGVDISNTPAGEELPEWLSPSSGGGGRAQNAAFDNMSFDTNLSNFAGSTTDSGTDWESPAGGNAKDFGQSAENNPYEATTMQEDDENIPDWMKSAGWGQRDPNTPEEPPAPLFEDEEEETTEEDGIIKASIPDWLKAMAPSDMEDKGDDTADEISSADLPDWLQGFSSEETAPSRIAPSSPPPQLSNADIPSWMATDDEPSTSDDALDLPDWLEGDNGPGDDEAELPALEKADMPDWLKDIGGAPASLPMDEEAEAPDWLGGVGSSAAQLGGMSLDDMEESTAPEWLQEMGSSTGSASGQEPETPDWLSTEGTEEAGSLSSDESALEDLFGESQPESVGAGVSWLDELTKDEADDTSLHSGVTDWLSNKEQEEARSAEAVPADDVPEWLQDLGQELPGTGELELYQTENPAAPMQGMDASFEVEDLGKDTGEDLELQDDAMAWLESLAARQGAKEEELLIKSEDRQDTNIPSWLEEIKDESPVEASDLADDGETVPEWLRDRPDEQAVAIPDAQEMLDLGDTLKMEDEEAEPSLLDDFEIEVGEGEALPGMEENEDAAMAWLESLAAKQGAKEEELLTAPTDRSEDVPEWLQGMLLEEEEPTSSDLAGQEIASPISESEMAGLFEEDDLFALGEPESETNFDLEEEPSPAMKETAEAAEFSMEAEGDTGLDEDAALAWLESLAMKHGVNEEELLTDTETRPEGTPDWVNVVAEEARAEEEAASALQMEASQAEIDFLGAFDGDDAVGEEESSELAQAGEGSDSAWLSDLLDEEEEDVLPASDGVPDWLTASTADLLTEADAMMPDVSEPVMDETTPEETSEVPAWLLEDEKPIAEEAEVASWIVDEQVEESSPASESEVSSWLVDEVVEETPSHDFEAETPAIEAAPLPVMESELETAVEMPVAVEAGEMLNQARSILSSGDVTAATEHYEKLIRSNQNVDEAIADITEALDTRYPVDIDLWQTLGDAFVKKNKLQDALDSYTKAEELLR